MPMKFRISSEFGALEEIRHGRAHTGIDLAMPKGTELHSITNGVIERVLHNHKSLGNAVYVRTGSGDLHLYGHLDKVAVHKGDMVTAGKLLGFAGSTGHSTGPHLHFSLLHNGHYADPSHLVGALQHFSGEIAGPAILGITGPAQWVGKKIAKHTEKALDSATNHIKESIINFICDLGEAILDLSHAAALLSVIMLVILGVMGYKPGYRYAGITLGVYALIQYLGRA